MSPGVQRLFADDYSSSGQIAWKQGQRGLGADYWADDLLGLLRFDALVAATVVVPDSHLFDGPFFLAWAPRDLVEALGAQSRDRSHLPVPLEIRGRGSGLADTLATLLVRDGSEMLNTFVFKTVADERLRPLLARQLGRTPRSDLERALSRYENVAAAVASVLRDAIHRVDPGSDPGLVDPIEEGWRRWLADESSVSVRTWPDHREFDLAQSLGLDPPVASQLRTRLGRDALSEVLVVVAQGSGHRADVSKSLAEPRAAALAAGDEVALADLAAIDNWYSRGRYRALAMLHGCSCALADLPGSPPLSAGQAWFREIRRGRESHARHIPLPDAVLRRLADVEVADFDALVFTRRRELRRWWTNGDADGLAAVAGALGDVEPSTKRKRIGLAQLLPFIPPALGYGAGQVLGDATTGAVIGAEAGATASLAMIARKTQAEKVQSRLVEAFVERAHVNGS